MNKFFKLLYVNLLGLFDFNKIAVARKEGVKSNLEKKSVITGIFMLLAGYILYSFFIKMNFTNTVYYFGLAFIISTIYCFVTNISLIEPIIFNNSDNDILFSYPVTKNQIVFSKLFSIYLKNIFAVLIIMIAALLAFLKVGKVDETLVLLFIVCILFIPFVPIIICTLLAYINDYFKVKMKKVTFCLVKYSLLLVIMIGGVLIAKSNTFSKLAEGLIYLIDKINIVYPFGYMFMEIMGKSSILFFFIYIILNILLISLYNTLMSNNIMKISSMLQGVNKKHHFEYHRTHNYHRVFGVVKKEIINLFNNKNYLVSSFGLTLIMFVVIVIGINMIDIEVLRKFEYFEMYFNNYGPALLGTVNTLNVMSISIMSLEKDNMQMLRTMPVNMGKVIFAKWLSNVLLSSIFIIIEAVIIIIKFHVRKLGLVLWICLPLCMMMMLVLTALVLDYTFISKREKSDNVIIRQRIIVFIPTILSLVLGLLPVFLNMAVKGYWFAGAYSFFMIGLMILEVVYLLLNRKKLLENLFN